MRHLLPLLLALAACSSDPAPPVDSGPLDTGPADTGADAPITHDWLFIDAGEDRPALVDAGALDASQVDAGADVGSDAGQLDDASDDGPVAPLDAAADRPDVVDVLRCGSGALSCGASCVNERTDPDNCGRCGARCLHGGAPQTITQPGATGCDEGVCARVTCVAGRANCDGNGANGCETDIRSDRTNCGVCGRVCTACDFGACINL